jgi:hypothetical protein
MGHRSARQTAKPSRRSRICADTLAGTVEQKRHFKHTAAPGEIAGV